MTLATPIYAVNIHFLGTSFSSRTAKSNMSDTSPVVQRYSADLESFDVGDAKVQHYGLLMKKPFGHKSGRWQKR